MFVQRSINYYLRDKSDLYKKSKITSYTQQDLPNMILITCELFWNSCFAAINFKNGTIR
jgi:hypothetical protein